MRLSMRQKRNLTKLSWRIGAAAAVLLIIVAPGGEPQPASGDQLPILIVWNLVLDWQLWAAVAVVVLAAAYFRSHRGNLTASQRQR